MKLYTEEQVIQAVRLALEDAEKSVIWSKEWYPSKLADRILKDLTPIELPSDEEIDTASLMISKDRKEFLMGAKYIIDKIQGGKQ